MVDPRHPFESIALQCSLALPFLGAVLCASLLRVRGGAAGARWPGFLAVVLAIVSLGLSYFAGSVTRSGGTVTLQWAEWIPGFGPSFSLYLDWLSSWLLLLLDCVAAAVVVFSLGYMRAELKQTRFFGGLLLFVGLMKLLLLAGSYLLMFAGWEGVGLASYILIGYHYERPKAAAAATKAFVVNRVGDAGFIFALLAMVVLCGSTSFGSVAAAVPHLAPGTVTLLAGCLAIGAMGKSAQFPLHIWLPDAMEGPTPVSALIHSATMVCAGVYLLARSSFLLMVATNVGIAIAVLGSITALFGASVALAENDIKRVLAYSTVSQIGFMFIALGLGAGQAAMYQVVTHAFFKSLLFLGAGAVIHALHGEQNMDHMGALRTRMPVTFACVAVGALTLAGLPGLSGFFSKDSILQAAFLSGHSGIAICGLLTSFLTAVYSGRLIAMVFLGEARSRYLNVHPLAPSMRAPMLALSLPCAFIGVVLVPLERSGWRTALASASLAFAGLFVAWFVYLYRPSARAILDEDFGPLTRFLRNRWYVDAIFEEHFVEGVMLTASAGASEADTRLLDGLVRGTGVAARRAARFLGWSDWSILDGGVRIIGSSVRSLSWPFRALQTGFVQTYALLVLVGAAAAIGYCLSR